MKKNIALKYLLGFGLILIVACNQVPQNTPITNIAVASLPTETGTDTTELGKKMTEFGTWLNECSLAKPKKSYIMLLNKMREVLFDEDGLPLEEERPTFCKEGANKFLAIKKDDFKAFIKAIDVSSAKDKYLMIAHWCDRSYVAVFDNTDNLIGFMGNNIEVDSLMCFHISKKFRLEDWDKDGNSDLLYDYFEGCNRTRNEWFSTYTSVLGFTGTENNMIGAV